MLATLDDGTISAIVTDPPYCSGGLTEREKQSRMKKCKATGAEWFEGDSMTSGGLMWLLRAVMYEGSRLLRTGGSAFVFTDWRMIHHLAPALESSGLLFHGILIWDKGTPGQGCGFRPTYEAILHYSKGTPTLYSSSSNIIRCKRVTERHRIHPTQKPVELLGKLIEITTLEGETVLDPFCGSGSTGQACVELGRGFVGVERSRTYVTRAKDRIKQTQEQLL